MHASVYVHAHASILILATFTAASCCMRAGISPASCRARARCNCGHEAQRRTVQTEIPAGLQQPFFRVAQQGPFHQTGGGCE
eukprot:282210-Pelagomonas_calceolata.AAC.1